MESAERAAIERFDVTPLPEKGRASHKVEVDFTEGRLAVNIDPSVHLLSSFINLTISRCRGSRQKSGGTSGSVSARGMPRFDAQRADVDVRSNPL